MTKVLTCAFQLQEESLKEASMYVCARPTAQQLCPFRIKTQIEFHIPMAKIFYLLCTCPLHSVVCIEPLYSALDSAVERLASGECGHISNDDNENNQRCIIRFII